MKDIETDSITKDGIIFSYLSAQRKGLTMTCVKKTTAVCQSKTDDHLQIPPETIVKTTIHLLHSCIKQKSKSRRFKEVWRSEEC